MGRKRKKSFQEDFEILNEIDILSYRETGSFEEEKGFIDDFEHEIEIQEHETEAYFVDESCSICGSPFHDEDVHWALGHGLSRKKVVYYDDEDDWIEYIIKKRGW